MSDGSFLLRFALLGVLVVASFVYPLLWLVVIFGFGAILDRHKTSKDVEPKPNFQYLTNRYVSAGDPQWRQQLERRCESPAEVAFLNAAIDAFDLRPEAGILRGGGLRLDLQVDIPPYRADFVAQGWLVIEVDGAAWHSSADAIERDRKRDEAMQGQGHRVLRLPAKLVFQSPDEAIGRVRAALAEGKPTVDRQTGWQPQQIPGSGLGKVAGALHILNENISQIKAVREALARPETTFHLEKRMIESAINAAIREMKVDTYIGNDSLKRVVFDAHTAELENLFERYDGERENHRIIRNSMQTDVPALTAPPTHEIAAVDASIKSAYQNLLEERSKYLDEQRARLRQEPRLRPLVQTSLATFGCPQVWTLIAPPPDFSSSALTVPRP